MFWRHVTNFFNSSFFIGLVTLAVGTFAYGVYRKQKHDAKRDAANIVLLEIEGAEQQLQTQRISESQPFTQVGEEDIYLMPQSSWEKYKYLFVRDFDRNEWDKIGDFYIKCHTYDDAVRFRDESFDKNQQELRVNLQHVLAEYADSYSKSLTGKTDEQKTQLEQEYVEKRKQFTDKYINTDPTHMYTYIAVKPYNDATRALKGLDKSMSLTSIGMKLKRMAYKKSLWRRFQDIVVGS